MTTTIKTGGGCSKWLATRGFHPVVGCKAKVAGAVRDWAHADGRTATVGYCLYSRTGQSSMGARAVWGYTVTIEGEHVCAA
jgi:hypothetical protein